MELFDFEFSDDDMKVIDGFYGVVGLVNDFD